MRSKDTLNRFLIDATEIRGSLVSLDSAWAAAIQRVDYPQAVQEVLGQVFAASVLLSATIKFTGKMTLQIRGDGPIHLLVVQVTAEQKMRGLARWTSEPTTAELSALFGVDARMTITIEASISGKPYQGIVELRGETLVDALRAYFKNSEQLETELILAVDKQTAAGLLLQKLPASAPSDHDAWGRTVSLAQTLTPKELLSLPADELLHRLYHEEKVRLFDNESVAFECACSKIRTDGLLKSFGIVEAQAILQEQGDITITCEFCDEVYRYQREDVANVFAADGMSDQIKSPTLH